MAAPALHPDCEPVAALLGTWRGGGHGDYPTIDPFDYVEEVTFGHVGKPFVAYTQRTRHATTDEPLHAEAGYLRCVGGAELELVIAQPSGIVETHTGSVSGGVVDLRSTAVAGTATAKDVVSVARHIEVAGDELRYELWMGAVGQPHQLHLTASLRRSD